MDDYEENEYGIEEPLLRRIVRDVLAERTAIPERPITVDTLSIDFEKRTVSLRGRTYTVETNGFAAPLLSTDRLVVSRGADVV